VAVVDPGRGRHGDRAAIRRRDDQLQPAQLRLRKLRGLGWGMRWRF
jgi:hypothetical protein